MVPRRVLHVLGPATTHFTSFNRWLVGLARHIDVSKYELHAWYFGPDGPLMAESRTAGIVVRRFDVAPGKRHPRALVDLLFEVRRGRFDLIHQHYLGEPLRLVARVVLGVPIVTHVHASTRYQAGPSARDLLQRADFVITSGRDAAEGHLGERVVAMPCGVEMSIPGKRPRGAEVVIGVAGRLTEIKGIGYLLRAFERVHRRVPRTRLEIAGDGVLRDALRDEASTLGIEERVSWLGWLDDVRAAMARWDIYVQPSMEDACPVSLIEAAAEGLPLIGSAVGGIPDLIVDGETGWLAGAGDAGALAERIERLATNPTARMAMGRAARLRAEERFSARRMAMEIEGIYDRVLGDRGG